jgi:hypothetical protein
MRRVFLLTFAVICIACTAAPVQPIGPTPAPTSAPTLAPKVTASTATPPPIDLPSYRAAMKPEFAAEVDRFGNAPQYQIDLTIAPDLKSYSATQVVTYTNLETVTLNEVYFSLFANLDSYGGHLQVQNLQVDGQDVQPIPEENDSALKVELAQPLSPGESIVIDMTYTGEVPTSDVELGYNQFGLHNNVLALPNFYPQIPAYDWRGWNIARGPGYGDAVFSDTALYRVNINAPADQVVATSGVCDRAGQTATAVYHCVSGPMRDFMIAMSADYAVKSNTVDGVKINSYYLKEDAAGGSRGLQVVSDSLKSYDRRIGPYPFSELDLVETPTSAGGIEYPGLIVIAQDLYQNQTDFFEGATAHETAHQWWYSLVGDDQVHDPWLDEALTQFTTGLYYHDEYGAQGMQSYVEQALQSRYDRVKGTADDKRSDLSVADYTVRQYSAIVYGKAALFFNAIYDAIGDAKFDQLLEEYYNTYRYGVAYPKDFLAIAAKYVGQDKLDELVKEWITGP